MRHVALILAAVCAVPPALAVEPAPSPYRLSGSQEAYRLRVDSSVLLQGGVTINRGLTNRPYASAIERAARQAGIAPELLHAVVLQESGYRPDAISPKGATGLAQLMPGTAVRYGVRDARVPERNLEAGASYLRDLLRQFNGDERLAVAAYNAGEGAVKRYGDIPPYAETRAYVPLVIGEYERLRASSRVVWPQFQLRQVTPVIKEHVLPVGLRADLPAGPG
ncbi:lytic transglycosylase domain-containing protein [Accumulibacter sp.]|jgi:soluble lytic murein transglycosylase-like protein|uniref:Lytic transglycosylase catalytic n=1 Tax=Accumulibacter regalis TaxID=522306 RepID=C7RNR8_ACCRE|nr:lytic transglycosylase domain-containing protein [Accumulibacter sp.]MBN8499137.1 lytic transglycosylase domain-containing protein [Accumulibacter sp.]MBO3714204.1 lytic transglycosylase domain-containing protein [Accumulibacter sp.]